MKHLAAALAVGSVFGFSAARAQTGQQFYDPAGGWTYVLQGDRADGLGQPGGAALDGTWSNNNTSDEWDGLGRGVGVGAIGGVGTRGGVLTIEDASVDALEANRKLYFVHDVAQNGVADDGWLDAGVTLYFRARLTPSTDPSLESGAPNGYGIFNSGRGNFSLRQAGPTGGTSEGIISFSLVNAQEDLSPTASVDFGASGLTLNRLDGDEAMGRSIDSDSFSGALNLVPLDPTEYHEFWIILEGNGDRPGTHQAIIYTDGVTSQNYMMNLTAGTGDEEGAGFGNYIGLGMPSTLATGSLDIDYFAFKAGLHAPVPLPEPGTLILLGLGSFSLWISRRRQV